MEWRFSRRVLLHLGSALWINHLRCFTDYNTFSSKVTALASPSSSKATGYLDATEPTATAPLAIR